MARKAHRYAFAHHKAEAKQFEIDHAPVLVVVHRVAVVQKLRVCPSSSSEASSTGDMAIRRLPGGLIYKPRLGPESRENDAAVAGKPKSRDHKAETTSSHQQLLDLSALRVWAITIRKYLWVRVSVATAGEGEDTGASSFLHRGVPGRPIGQTIPKRYFKTVFSPGVLQPQPPYATVGAIMDFCRRAVHAHWLLL